MDSVAFESINTRYQGLITQERVEKFNLLGQLILNQREAIIVSGCEGIGKTTFLNALKKNRADIWIICLLQGIATLSFEQVQNQLILAIQEYNPDTQGYDLQTLLGVCEQRQQRIVLAIDDAVYLASGFINTLIEYALHNPVIRIIFALTKEQLYLKNLTDRTIDNCYFVEIPPLTSSQVSVFIQDILVLQGADKKLDNKWLTKLYRQTDGIPGKVIANLPLLLETKPKNTFVLPKVMLFGGCFIMAILAIYRLTGDQHPPLVSSISTFVSPDVRKTLDKQGIKSKPVTGLNKQTEANRKTLAIVKNSAQIQLQLTDDQWVLQQDARKYTLQLMALSKQQPLLTLVKKYQKLQPSLKVFQIKNRAQENYVLLYGSFANASAANQEVNSLPAEFKSAWPRRFDTLQKR